MRLLLLQIFCFMFSIVHAQNNTAVVSGKIIDNNENPLSQVSVIILGKEKGAVSNDSGNFIIKVPAEKSIALTFSYTGFKTVQKNFFLSNGETENVMIRMINQSETMNAIVITDEKERNENGLIKINPKNAVLIPSTTGGVESLIKTLVGSNNELSSQYNVRGGNYDENIVYINDFEVYRPYLVSNGQQEGLSFINPEMVKNINFYTGGFQAKYGDKMSSVLDIQYKKPTQFSGSAYISPLEQGLSLSGNFKKGKATYVVGVRNKSNKNVLSNQPTLGSYLPSASDLQSLFTYKLSNKLQLELLTIFSSSRFTYYPESVKKTSSVFSPFYTANIGLDIYFDGQEKDKYSTNLIGTTLNYTPNKKLKLSWLFSRFKDKENENYDIIGAYLFGDRDFDNTSSTFGEIVNPLGAGLYQQYARNQLNIEIWNAGHRGNYERGKHYLQWGINAEHVIINDRINQFEYQDSAGYSLPFQPGTMTLYNSIYHTNELAINKFTGFIQDNIHVYNKLGDFTFQLGARFNYNGLNKEMLVSPRIQSSWKPNWKKDIVLRAAVGVYNQPPFYRELSDANGNINKSILSQKSYQFVTGMDYQFKRNDRPVRFSAEAYYKSMNDIIPYDIDNVKIRYLGSNNAKAYATGLELRIFSELLKDAESWFSLGFMKTSENLNNDYYYDNLNAAGEIINASSTDQRPTDSIKNEIGFLRRPSDRRITAGLFLQDYLSTNKNFKVHLNLLYGSNMPYNIPGSTRYRNALIVDPYLRVDIGFSALLISDETARRSHNPFKGLKNVWASLEIFNLINKANTISYQLIKDFSNNTYAIPNRLTPRLLNFKLITRF